MIARWTTRIALALGAVLVAGSAQAFCTTRSDASFFWRIKDNPTFNMTISLQDTDVCQIVAWESLGTIKEIRIVRRPTTGRFEFLYDINALRYTPHPSKPTNDDAEIRFCAERFGEYGCVTIKYNYTYAY